MVLWLAAGLATLLSGMLGLLMLVMVPIPGADTAVVVLKAVLVIGWLGIGVWQFLQLFTGRWRFVLAPFAAWVWIYAVGLALGRMAFLNWGY